jgi:hypothetical protein
MTDEIISLREFAKRKDVSLTAVQKACAPEKGRITPERDETGKITGINWTTQAAAWEANAKGHYKPHSVAGGRPRNDGQATASPKTSKAAAGPSTAPAAPPADDQPSTGGPMKLADITRARELVKLQIDNIKLKQAQGELVPAAEQEAQGASLGAMVIAALYNIPERISDDLAGMSNPHDIQKLLTAEIDIAVEALRKLANAS